MHSDEDGKVQEHLAEKKCLLKVLPMSNNVFPTRCNRPPLILFWTTSRGRQLVWHGHLLTLTFLAMGLYTGTASCKVPQPSYVTTHDDGAVQSGYTHFH